MQKRWITLASVSLCTLGLAAACSDDTMTGPMFGDVAFRPSIEDIGSARSVELAVSNEAGGSLGPILVGVDAVFQTVFPDSLCTSIQVSVAPSSIASLASGAETTVDVTIDTQNVDNVDCPPDKYDADLFAAVGGRVVGGATVRFDWDGTPP